MERRHIEVVRATRSSDVPAKMNASQWDEVRALVERYRLHGFDNVDLGITIPADGTAAHALAAGKVLMRNARTPEAYQAGQRIIAIATTAAQ